MTGRTQFEVLRRQMQARSAVDQRLAAVRARTVEETCLYQLRRAESISQLNLAGRLNVTQGAISKLEHAEDLRISTLRHYLKGLGAQLELTAVFDVSNRRVPIYLGPPEA